MKPHDKQEVMLLTDPDWSFDDAGPGYSLSFDGCYARREKVDPAPCYANDLQAVQHELAHLRRVAPIPVPLGIFILSREMVGRTNAWFSPDRVYVNGNESYQVGLIAMSGKRIPIHPAMTRYLVAHEYGHFVEAFLTSVKGYKSETELREDYRRLVRPDAQFGYGPGKWHAHIAEIFANDFRILVAGREPEFWPHPTVSRPEENLAAIGWWTQVREQFWLPTADEHYAVDKAKEEPAA